MASLLFRAASEGVSLWYVVGMSDFDLLGMGDFLPPEPVVREPCAHCEEERDLPQGVDLFIGPDRVCYLCLRDYLDDRETPSGRDYLTEEIITELQTESPANKDAEIYRLPPS